LPVIFEDQIQKLAGKGRQANACDARLSDSVPETKGSEKSLWFPVYTGQSIFDNQITTGKKNQDKQGL
jgi:hypothetical protein